MKGLRWSDALFLGVGGLLGYQLQVASVVEGTSMMPTLEPRQRLLHFPLWALGWWCWPFVQCAGIAQRLMGVSGREAALTARGYDAVPSSPPSLSWRGHTSPRVGDVVLAVVADDGTTVCKRVVSITDQYDSVVVGEWEAERFRSAADDVAGNDDAELFAEYDESDHRREQAMEEAEVLHEAELEEAASPHPSDGLAADVVAGDAQQLPEAPPPDRLALLHRQAAERSVIPRRLPRRSTEWDACRAKGLMATAPGSAVEGEQWLWLEGDNPANSFDSRHAGAVPASCVKGLVVAVWWPLSDAKML